MKTAQERGYQELKLDTLAHLETAIALYKSFGFESSRANGNHPYPGLVCLERRCRTSKRKAARLMQRRFSQFKTILLVCQH